MLMLHRVVMLVAGLLVVAGLRLPAGALAAGDANNAACPNEALEGFREYLPDCRGYELVTPSFEDGQNVGVKAVSEDGSRLLLSTVGVFSGAQGDVGFYGTSYLLSRSGTGWSVSPVGPSQASFPAQRLEAVSTDLGGSLWVMHTPAQSIETEDLYLREADGSFVLVGPLVSPAASAGPPGGSYQSSFYGDSVWLAGESSDLSHVLFELDGAPLWSGDTTLVNGNGSFTSLYEYVGVGNTQPSLVGVDDEGHLISDCETVLGSVGNYDIYNAVSESGETVFFTAVGDSEAGSGPSEEECRGRVEVHSSARAPGVNELYARLGGFPIDTVSVSEPTEGACEACQTGVATPRHSAVTERPAEFQGASQDGSKVFFLSEQELFAGAKGMNLWEYDFNNPAGHKVVHVSTGIAGRSGVEPRVLGVARVSEDGSHVYFVAQGVLTEGRNGEGREPVEDGDNLYVFERDAADPAGRLQFVATLSERDEGDWSTTDERRVQATPDGRFLVFVSRADLTAGDTSSQRQVFEYDAQSETLVRVSVGQAGYPAGAASANANSSSFEPQIYREHGTSTIPAARDKGLVVSADGSVVVFGSAAGLTPEAEVAAAAGVESVYEYRSAGSIANGSVYLISDGTSTLPAGAPMLDASGDDVFFLTADALVAGDGNTEGSVYDARVGGGASAPSVSAGCVGEACRGAGSVAPVFGAPGSVSGVGGGNLASPPGGQGAAPVPKPRTLTRAQKLAAALRACLHEPKRGRRACEARARKRYRIRSVINAKDKV
jgi:hypothetical protein